MLQHTKASHLGEYESALAKVDETLAKAADKNEMVVFPELYFPGYNQMKSHPSVAQKQGESWELSLLSKKHGCGLTLAGLSGRDSIYNGVYI